MSTSALLGETGSLCGVCKGTVLATLWRVDDRVVMRKTCPDHGAQEALIAEDADWYQRTVAHRMTFEPPPGERREVKDGCPLDCGPCTGHEQRLHLPVIPITSACNLDCPICYTHNKNDGAYHMSEDELSTILRHLRTAAPERRIVNLTGGEPTQHPAFERLVERCAEEGIERITISTHGMRFLRDEHLLAKLASLDARVILSFDSFRDSTNRALLGGEFTAPKLKVLDLLEKHDVNTTLLPVLCLGVNDDELGAFVELALSRDFIRSLELHTMTFTGQSGGGFDRQTRYTPDRVLGDLERATEGRIAVRDFIPAPVAHPLCYQVTYLLRMERDWVPFPRFMGPSDLRALLERTLYLLPGPEMESRLGEVIARLWAEEIPCDDRERTLAVLKRLVAEIFAPGLSARQRLKVAERSTKAIYLHNHMDEETFDTERIRQCCVGMPGPLGNNVPSCAYNVLYRERDPRFTEAPRAAVSTLKRQVWPAP